MCVSERHKIPAERRQGSDQRSFWLLFLTSSRFAVLHKTEFPTQLLLDKVGLYFLSQLPNMSETEFLHP